MLIRPFFSERAIVAKICSRLDIFSDPDFKDLTTMPDHQSNKTCRRWGSFRYLRLLFHAGMENHVRKYIAQITFFRLLRNVWKDNIFSPSIGIAYEPIPYCSSYKIWLATICMVYIRLTRQSNLSPKNRCLNGCGLLNPAGSAEPVLLLRPCPDRFLRLSKSFRAATCSCRLEICVLVACKLSAGDCRLIVIVIEHSNKRSK